MVCQIDNYGARSLNQSEQIEDNTKSQDFTKCELNQGDRETDVCITIDSVNLYGKNSIYE